MEDIPVTALHVDERRLTRYTQYTSLDSLANMADIFVWYAQIRIETAMFGVPLMPFDGIVLEYVADGLCVPGNGIQMYTKCGAAFLYILRKTLPLSTSQ